MTSLSTNCDNNIHGPGHIFNLFIVMVKLIFDEIDLERESTSLKPIKYKMLRYIRIGNCPVFHINKCLCIKVYSVSKYEIDSLNQQTNQQKYVKPYKTIKRSVLSVNTSPGITLSSSIAMYPRHL